ncbi:MAG: hypothetical protein EAZ35_11130 [Sphingobacteriia bacterium]|nr:MAG: hypothetical protein EAZ41_05040 [Sphingobacteriia bacterium]TAG29332.1 MAG: hypothetical protein EAZ35_11130 [Sphingobacteriia bacterium]
MGVAKKIWKEKGAIKSNLNDILSIYEINIYTNKIRKNIYYCINRLGDCLGYNYNCKIWIWFWPVVVSIHTLKVITFLFE